MTSIYLVLPESLLCHIAWNLRKLIFWNISNWSFCPTKPINNSFFKIYHTVKISACLSRTNWYAKALQIFGLCRYLLSFLVNRKREIKYHRTLTSVVVSFYIMHSLDFVFPLYNYKFFETDSPLFSFNQLKIYRHFQWVILVFIHHYQYC